METPMNGAFIPEMSKYIGQEHNLPHENGESKIKGLTNFLHFSTKT